MLNWTDYQGDPDYSDSFRSAVTASAMKFTTKCLPDGTLEYNMTAEFLKDKSWVKPEALTEYHLGHEQLHFDITEYNVRRFRQIVDSLEFSCEDQEFVQKLAEDAMRQCYEMQANYDKETQFSLNKTQQLQWELAIKKRLDEFAHLELKK